MTSTRTLTRGSCLAAALSLTAAVGPSGAQETESDSGGMLVGFLEDTLSADSRYITVTGLTGALSSQATIERLTVADDDGIWLTIEEAKLDWNRLALLQGRFSVNSLSAESITVVRSPTPVPADPELPTPEATPLRLPELPVAIELGEIRAGRVDLGEDLLGQSASLSVTGALSLADGALQTRLETARLDKPGDRLSLVAGYSDQTRQIDLDLSLTEAAGGLLSTVLALPGRPTLGLTAKGSGPVTDFKADIALSSNGQERLSGQVVLAARQDAESEQDAGPSGIAFSADLGGDIDPLLLPDYRPFFGPGLRLVTRGQTVAEGGVALDTLALSTRALRVTGALATGATGNLDTANLKVQIQPPSGEAAVVLPVPGAATTLAGADLTARKTTDGAWSVAGTVSQLSHPQMRLGELRLDGSGTLKSAADDTGPAGLVGDLRLALRDFAPRDPALAQATGSELELVTTLTTDGPDALSLTGLTLSGSDYRAAGDATFSGLDSGLRVAADLSAGAGDLSRFSALAGRPLGGAVQALFTGQFTPLSGAFDVDLNLQAQDLSADIAQLDALMTGPTTLKLVAARGTDGLRIDDFTLDSRALSATASGSLDSAAGRLSLTARLLELEQLVPEVPGTLELAADLTRDGDILSGQARLKGPHSSRADLEGSVQLDGSADLTFDAALNELQRFVPELPGVLAAKGEAQRKDGVWSINASATAPAEARADLSGTFSEASGAADIAATGQLRLEGANPFIKPNLTKGAARFDLAMKGPPALESITGTITTSGATLALPSAGQRVDDINATVTLQQARALLQLSASPGDSGSLRVSGPVALAAPFNADLSIEILDLLMSDHLSYDSQLNGRLALTGALTGNSRLSGRIDVGETNINLNATGGSVTAAPIPPISHIGASGAVNATRARAGLITSAQSTGGSAGRSNIALDVVIDAPGKIFARGRGLRAELGGRIHLRGSTARILPAGQIGLIRGTFDILGRRLDLDEGQITLLGNLVPYLEFRSSAQTEQGSATLEISGLIDAPEIKVTSEPPRPSEEALALLLFGDNIKDLSPLALARLAASALQLSGRGGQTQDTLRQSTGADDAEVGLDSLGAGRLGLGGYISENVYTDVDVNTRGDSELSINLDLSKSLTVSGKVDSEGESGLGLFFKRDY
ncbi:MAG: translocation/assembly module TamB domain-containing protein [Pseudophaeobacter sp. bin_em_oilr2.035]|uniref:Translocation/assembly module TamB domain-containing protein n=1 Tax=Phaeobacter gallaeciensis TaxID=60890 RepID=A0ABD4X5G5_9RHOB|nr:translocation/assembly module TamB domain-containing protein [Phaeobacter gallaeciensis]MDF1770346.1 translocation/assembly module TamB domain-containing protein [Pseudophaeobacter sp. bin_em_oilr2.035]MDE4143317.1 translocation/assembly module TamB domain-containing protein [Phaeobacter gallaeciensis]MDE4156322.1 translocation/assembly module TamB domain-containing protein [Phaeobacter gallaeciensis]MDE4160509.1 translocation/assembly module TamB domain-containing protein [Phaeobacter galla